MHIVPLIGLFAELASAWLPGQDRVIEARDGTSLFSNFTSVTGRSASKRYLPSQSKVRGVNLGSLFIIEPWMISPIWNDMGCGGQNSEFDCVNALGQDQANSVFQNHWDTFITQDDINQIRSAGLNTIRVPVGYWMKEDIVYRDSEHFPEGGFTYLQRLCGWASDAGLYIIIDLHGAPGAQVANNAFTGQYASTPGFYVDYQFERALQFLEWMAEQVHTINEFRNVGMLEIVNEPVQNSGQVGGMRSNYYPDAFSRIRAAEQKLGVTANNELHIQMMNNRWGSGEPTEYLTDTYFAAYDDHRYLKFANIENTQDNYISTSCNDDRGGNTPTIVGEWSISPADSVENDSGWDKNTQQAFYKRWFAAQVIAYEKQLGWTFWSWKTQLGDYRWDYQAALQAGVIPSNLDDVYNEGAC